MKNLNSFKAFELGKAQMNEISGGTNCYVQFGDEPPIPLTTGLSKEEAEKSLRASYDGFAETWCD